MAQFHSLTITKIIKETVDAVSILFDVPTALQNDFTFVAGQYITIKKEINGTELRRAYSICSSPNSGKLKIAIKTVENGVFSTYAVTQLKEGDVLEVSKPEGRFVLKTNTEHRKNYIAFVAGSGITPVFSMLQAVLEKEPQSNFYLVFGNKKPESTIFKNALENLATQYQNLFVQHVFSQTKEENALFGHIDTANTNYHIKNIWKDIAFDKAYICGPEKMITTVSETLKNNNFLKENIHFELFTTSIPSEEKNAEKKTNFTGKTTITVILDDETLSFETDSKKSLLDSILKEDIDAPYSCQGGVCTSCLAKITDGSAKMNNNITLTEAEVAEGLVLTCIAHATSPSITIDFDEA